jgi:hypothetical protein
MEPLLYSGARGRINYRDVNGNQRTLGIALDLSVSVNESVQQTFVIGSYNAPVLDPTAIDVSVSMSTVIPMNTATSSTTPATNISAIDLGLEASIQNVLVSQSVTIEIMDRITNKVLASIRECRFAGRSISTSATGVASARYQFSGILDAGRDGTENSAAKLGYDDSQS